jgi:hypothetical protein
MASDRGWLLAKPSSPRGMLSAGTTALLMLAKTVPPRIADGDIGNDRKRSTTPLDMSLATPTAAVVPTSAAFDAITPGMRELA